MYYNKPMIKLDSISQFVIPLIEVPTSNISTHGIDVEKGLSTLFAVVIIPVLIILFFIIRSIYRNTIGKKLKTTILQDYKKEAKGYERSGKFVSAANIYEKRLKDTEKAASLYEKGKDYRQAASLYEQLGMIQKAKEMYEKDGDFDKAAEAAIRGGDYEEAAKLYIRAGKKVDAALTMEKAGRKLAAVKVYREAGEYRSASRLLEEDGMLKEATEMFGLSLREQKPEVSNIDDFYTYASMLEKIGDMQAALGVFKEIDKTDPTFRDVRERIHKLTPASEDEEELEGKTTLRNFIKSGSIEPKHSLKFWVQILRSLQEAYKRQRPYGLLSPDNVAVDDQNNISFLNKTISSAYISPESLKELELDVRADIYSAGVILYEMLTGDLNGIGSVRVIDTVEDVPEWLDEIVIKCIKKVREDRYQNIEEIFIDLKNLSKSKK